MFKLTIPGQSPSEQGSQEFEATNHTIQQPERNTCMPLLSSLSAAFRQTRTRAQGNTSPGSGATYIQTRASHAVIQTCPRASLIQTAPHCHSLPRQLSALLSWSLKLTLVPWKEGCVWFFHLGSYRWPHEGVRVTMGGWRSVNTDKSNSSSQQPAVHTKCSICRDRLEQAVS